MAARPRRMNFVHQRTVRLIVEEDMQLDSLTVVNSLEEFKDHIVGVVPQFGGKCFDITIDTIEAVTSLVTSGFDYENQIKPLRLLGQKALHISVFVPIEFPDEDLLDLLKGYGSLKSPTLRRLRFKEEGFQHLENGIRVTQFTELIICRENWSSRASKFLSVTPASLSSATGVTRLSMWLKTARDAGKIFLYNQPTTWSPQGAKVSPKIQLQAHQPHRQVQILTPRPAWRLMPLRRPLRLHQLMLRLHRNSFRKPRFHSVHSHLASEDHLPR